MILIDINTKDYENDVRVMTQAFYPDNKIITRIAGEPEITDAPEIHTVVNATDRNVRGNVEGYTFEFEEDTDDKKIIRNHIKRELYNIYSRITGKKLPWGTLTGIRPVKIPLGLAELSTKTVPLIKHGFQN